MSELIHRNLSFDYVGYCTRCFAEIRLCVISKLDLDKEFVCPVCQTEFVGSLVIFNKI
jgi:hypothetical protein